ncbi:hypoxanthine phosphoribosyltransferase [Candidatus Oleimmundimicrobium sp.]|uniref:hypoxanthine phosphoribosyltransferase n=1 Tax=Candidatus Oleimmundimicrobium sp. TaxID=3060597 RepID=UPI002722E9C0|nr:hypoxanthine phosphoribosyltransferase [Candidatus Oleimmundimicrobium sp.]MDO8885330.1 hypoxanthine phosphoribosyltransferase [Candidatus Oleimmundimicrobium sp.]
MVESLQGNNLSDDIERVFFTKQEIQEKVDFLGKKISCDYKGKDLLLINILKGGVVFLSNLIMSIDIGISIDFMAISSYGPSSETTGAVKLIKDLEESIEGRNILVVEDIIDTGLTLNYLTNNLKARQPASLKICTLLDKSVRRIVDMPIDYKGFDVPDVFLVGYGLDYKQKYRNLPYIGILKKEVYLDKDPMLNY